jgi:hypothetical protein
MLRRKPTAITLTAEDISAYEDARQREAEAAAQAHAQAQIQARQGTPGQKNQNRDPNDELRPLPEGKVRVVRTREERLGLVGRS